MLKTTPKNESSQSIKTEIKAPSKLMTEYYYSVVLLLIAILIGGGMFIIRPMIDGYKETLAATEALKQEINDENAYFEGVSRSVAAAKTIDPEVLKRVESSVPRKFEEPSMLVMLDSLAKASNVHLTSVSFNASQGTAATSGAEIMDMSIGIDVMGYESFKTFLRALETNLRLIDVTNFNIAGFENAGTKGMSLQLKTYYFPSAVYASGTVTQ